MSAVLCEGPRCGGRTAGARQVEPGLRLCRNCRDQLTTDLAALPGLHQHCETLLAGRRHWSVERIRGGGRGEIRLDDTVVTVRSRMLTVLSSWAGLVVRERPLSGRPRRTVVELSATLGAHVSWLAAHPAAGDLAAEVASLVTEAHEAIGPRHARRRELGACDRPGCDAPVYADLGAGTTAATRVACSAGHVCQPHRWLELAGRWEWPSTSSGPRGVREEAR